MKFFIPLLIFSAVMMAGYAVVLRTSTRRQRVQSVLAQYGMQSATPAKAQKAKAEPELLDRVAAIVIRPGYRRSLRSLLDRSGVHDTNAVKAMSRRKIVFAAGGLIWGGVMAAAGAPFGFGLMLLGAAIGFFLPDVLAYNNAIKRDELVARTLSDALDLLNLCVESGMGLQPALAQVAKSQQGPVAEEFSRVLREMQLGKSRTEAFEALGDRTRQPDLKRFVEAVARTESLGIPVASMMKEQSAEMRSRRKENAREKAQKVPVKILLPVMACLLPGLFIIVLGPAAITMVRAFSQM